MPPKKNVKKGKQTVNESDESSSNKQDSAKNTMKVEVTSRVLRSRNVPPPTERVPALKTSKIKNDANGVTSNKTQENKGKRTKVLTPKNSEEGEPVAKHIKIGQEEEPEQDEQDNNVEHVNASSIYDFKAKTIEGEEVSLSKYKGHVCIIVNVASRCGHTSSNYKDFVEIYNKYSKDKGLRILAFPCNQFGKQEPGDNEKICEFAKKKNVNFDMYEKIDVNGKSAHPLWKYLTSQKDGPKGAKIDWNFTKFLIDKNGQVVDRFKSAVKPLVLVQELEKLW